MSSTPRDLGNPSRGIISKVVDAILAKTGLHQSVLWEQDGYRQSRARKLFVLSSLSDDQAASSSSMSRSRSDTHLLNLGKKKKRKDSTYMRNILKSIDATLVKDDMSALSYRGVLMTTAASAIGFYALRMLTRDLLRGYQFYSKIPTFNRRKIFELYLFSTFHALAWVGFGGFKVLRGKWDNTDGVDTAVCLSMGYYLHDILSLRSSWTSDPLMYVSLRACCSTALLLCSLLVVAIPTSNSCRRFVLHRVFYACHCVPTLPPCCFPCSR
jgi:hypothetical protein